VSRPQSAPAGPAALGELPAVIGTRQPDKAPLDKSALLRLMLQRWLAGELPLVGSDERGEYVRGAR
jgi:hypothetical protein